MDHIKEKQLEEADKLILLFPLRSQEQNLGEYYEYMKKYHSILDYKEWLKKAMSVKGRKFEPKFED